MIDAKVICDSISPAGHRLFTVKLRYPKFIHGELMTHRVFSRNASSSRAIPVAKLIAEVRDDATRAAPVWWGKEQKGMQSGEELSDIDEPSDNCSPKYRAQYQWEEAAIFAAERAEAMVEIGVHKSIVNRILEPFSHINVLVTATEWMNFFGLRLDKAAQPEMRVLAEAIWRGYNESKPKLLQPGEWHLPFVSERDDMNSYPRLAQAEPPSNDVYYSTAIKVSVARCARISYESFETGKRSTVKEDLKLYDRLIGAQPMHASPAEHQATPDVLTPMSYIVEAPAELTPEQRSRREISTGISINCYWDHPDEHGNFVGWRMYRKMLCGESVAPLPKEIAL